MVPKDNTGRHHTMSQKS